MGSLNGTFVNGQKIESAVPISKKDVIEMGKFVLTVIPESTQEVSTSYAAPAMDTDDETIYIRSKKPSHPPKSKVKKGTHQLILIAGKASPDILSMDGKSSIKIGKDISSDMVVTGWLIAGAQCYIISRDEKYYIIPQGRWVGTRLNGVKIKNEHVLHSGDIIEIRQTKIRFE